MGMLVNVDNFARAESDRMLSGAAAEAGGVNKWAHRRLPTALDEQSVIRMNRDTLYSMALVDISEGATLTVPETGDRYVSVMAVNQDHYVNRVFHEPGEHSLGVDEFDTPYLGLAVRLLVDPGDAADVAAVNALQDRFVIEAASETPFRPPDYDTGSLDATRQALLELARGITASTGRSGRRTPSTPSGTSSAQPPAGAGCPSARRPTSTSSRTFRSGRTASPCKTFPSMRSGRSPSTTPTASSSRLNTASTASTASPRTGRRTGRSSCASVAARTTGPTVSR